MTRKLLLVDDNLDWTMSLRIILEAHAFAVKMAQSGRQGLDQLNTDRPDVVLLDVTMPDMSGLQVLERIKANPITAEIPVIMLTAKTQDEDLMTGYQHGADYYITKPCTAQQVLYGIGVVLGELDPAASVSVEQGTAAAPRRR